jgi:hypothetical protein
MTMTAVAPWIGTLRERPLHAALKRWCARPDDAIEVAVDGFVIDIVRGDLLIEVQTRSLSSARHKIATLLERGHRVRIVLPVLVDAWIVRVGEDGALLGRRMSPRHGHPSDAFAELVSIAPLLAHPRLEIDLVLVEVEEHRRHAPDGPWRRRGWAVIERRLVSVIGTVPIRGVGDLAMLLPPGLPDRFTTGELATRLGRSTRIAQQMAYCLRLAEVVVPVGRRGRGVDYRRVAGGS